MTLALAVLIAFGLLCLAAVVVGWACCVVAGQCDDEEGTR
jgi:nitrogen fixation-related uncharacterized protein